MNEQLVRTQIHHAVEQYCEKCQVNDLPYLAQRVLNASQCPQPKGGRIVKKKVSVGLILALILVLLSVTALAAGIALNIMTPRVAQMDADGTFISWGLDEKYVFVQAMRDSGYTMNENDWNILNDAAQPSGDREAAADRIVYERYGAVQQEANARRPQPKETVMGEAPDAVDIFRERFLAENPEATYYDYLDALGYWLRDEYYPQFEAAQPPVETPLPSNAITEDTAKGYLTGYLTEVFNWPASVVENTPVFVQQDEKNNAWHVTATVDATALKDALGPMIGDATFESDLIAFSQNSYTVSMWVTRLENGDWQYDQNLETLLANAAETSRIHALHTIYVDEANAIGVQAVADKYSLSEAEVKKYFIYNGDTYWNDPSCVRVAVLLRTRNNSGAPWDYAAIVNMTTAQAEDVFAAGDLPEKARLLARHWDELQENEEWLHYLRFFTTWNPYGWYTNMPPDEYRQICEAFQEQVKKQQEALSDKNAYYPLMDFALPPEGE